MSFNPAMERRCEFQAASVSSQSQNLGAGITLLPARADVLAMHSYAAVAEKKP